MKEDIIQMARQAGYSYSEASELDFDRLKRFAASVAAASEAKEREACAVLAEKEAQYSVATAIRARGQA